jgi:hypothetical protein
MTVLCEVSDLHNDERVNRFRDLATSVEIPKGENFCQKWVENVLETAVKKGWNLPAPPGA